MLDWYGGLIGYDARELKLGQMYEVSPAGEIIYSTERWIKAQGSFESSVQIRRDESTEEMRRRADKLGLVCNPTVLQISGNPVKFLQGHNVFGPSVSALAPVLQAFTRALPLDLRPTDADSKLWPAVHRSRVDTNVMIDLGDDRNVHDWLRFAGSNSRSRHGLPDVTQRGLTGGDTIYWGKHSRRWSMKAYCKLHELKAHPVPDEWLQKKLENFAHGQLRIELTLRTPELKNRGTLDESLVWEFYEKIGVGVMKKDVNLERPNLKPAVESTLTLWLAGVDMTVRLPRRTFYRHRMTILEETGLDISLPRASQEQAIDSCKFDLEYLKAHEVKNIPSFLQGWLFAPGEHPRWSKNDKLEA